MEPPRLPLLLSAVLAGLCLAACGGGGGGAVSQGPSGGLGPLSLLSLSVSDGDVLELNRPIELVFDRAVDPTSIGPNTIAVRSTTGVPAAGTYRLAGANRVVFEPACPTVPGYADAGLRPGGIAYRIRVFGLDDGPGATVRSADGDELARGVTRTFSTATGDRPELLFHDPIDGPPSARVRLAGSTELDASYVEVGGDDRDRRYFELDPASQRHVGPAALPINLRSDPASAITVVLVLDQPLDPAPQNLARLRLETRSASGPWLPVGSRAELLANCGSGAHVRVTPTGILAPGGAARVVMDAGLCDVVGQALPLAIDDVATFTTRARLEGEYDRPDVFSDELLEDFAAGANQQGSWEDAGFSFAGGRARWGDGLLAASGAFPGSGGPGGDFDWVIAPGEVFVFDTTSTVVTGGPPGQPTAATFTDGYVDARSLWVQAGGVLRIQGPHPFRLRTTGDVAIDGLVDLCGFDADDVDDLAAASAPEIGGAGAAGGGRGGTGSPDAAGSTPSGGAGAGAFHEDGRGGSGGETGYGAGTVDTYFPGGGGGGVFGPPENGFETGLRAESGQPGGTFALGAMSGSSPPAGGAMGPSPFVDGDPTNDFCGVALDPDTGEAIVGELAAPRAGGGGGAGGDAVREAVFPNPFFPAGDWKGAGGGGGAGCFDVWALGDIRFGRNGRIRADGGKGAYGQRIHGGLPVGGGSGGGAGGHVILQASGQLRFHTLGANAITALGGAGGRGSTQLGPFGAGGDGGPGLVQLHVADPAEDLVLPGGVTLASRAAPNPLVLMPIEELVSRARSTWIPLDGAAASADAAGRAIDFVFGGTDAEGFVLDADRDGRVDPAPPLLGPVALLEAPAVPHLASDGVTFVLDAGSWTATLDDVFQRNPRLLVGSHVVLQSDDRAYVARYPIAHAAFDPTSESLRVEVAGTVDLPPVPVQLSLVPRFFGVQTEGIEDALPANASIQILFQTTGSRAPGVPETDAPLTPWTADASVLDVEGAAFLRFEVRFAVEGTDDPEPALDFLRIPFRF